MAINTALHSPDCKGIKMQRLTANKQEKKQEKVARNRLATVVNKSILYINNKINKYKYWQQLYTQHCSSI